MAQRWPRIVAWVVAGFWVGSGLWAFLAPRSFYDQVATFPPYNIHFLHDIGALSIGLGAVIVLALLGGSALRAALLGVGIGSAVHVLSHVVDYDLKSDPADIAGLAVITVAALAAGLAIDRAR